MEIDLWRRNLGNFIHKKYIYPLIIEQWIKSQNKISRNVSIIQKVIIKSYEIIGDLLSWEIDDRKKIKVGYDPWPGCYVAYKLPMEMIDNLKYEGI